MEADTEAPSNNDFDPTSKSKKYHRVVIFGPPACGKGTQSQYIVKQFGYTYIATGEVLREEATAGTPEGQQAKKFMDAGDLIPDQLVMKMIQNKLLSQEAQKNGWLLDGMPRTVSQSKLLDDLDCRPDLIINLEVAEDLLLERVCGRRLDPVTGKTYHLKFDPPPADIESRLTQRSDDTEDKLKARLKVFHQQSGPVIAEYKKNGDDVFTVDGGRKAEQVFADISKKLTSSVH